MKHLIYGIVLGAALALLMDAAFGACPPGTAYRCYQGYNGKQICGCFRY